MRIGLPNVKLLKGASILLFLLRENLARFEVVVSFSIVTCEWPQKMHIT